jgi:hypothetical protein
MSVAVVTDVTEPDRDPIGWGGTLTTLARAQWPAGDEGELPAVAGFINSDFSPLAAAVAERCLRDFFGAPPADQARGERMAIVLTSGTGDLATAAAVADAVQAGRRVPPLLFFQSNPNAVAGYIAARWGLAGPVVCTMPTGDVLADAIESAGLLIESGDAAAALVIVANAHLDGRVLGSAMLIGPSSWRAEPVDSPREGRL